MLKVISFQQESVINGTVYGRAEICVEDSSELATTSGSMEFTSGSIAWDISTGEFYGFTGGSWYKQDGSGAYSAEVSPSVQSVDNGRSVPDTKALPEEDLRREEPVIEEESEEKEESPEVKEDDKR